MGLFDTFRFNCWACGEETESQSKIFGEMNLYDVGDRVDNYNLMIRDMKLELKEPCHKCQCSQVAIIVHDIFTGVEAPGSETHRESNWGGLTMVDDSK